MTAMLLRPHPLHFYLGALSSKRCTLSTEKDMHQLNQGVRYEAASETVDVLTHAWQVLEYVTIL